MKHFSGEPWAAFTMLFFATVLRYSCSAAAEDVSNVSTSSMLTTEYEAPCLNPCQTDCLEAQYGLPGAPLPPPRQVFPKQPVPGNLRFHQSSQNHPPSQMSNIPTILRFPKYDVNFCTQAATCCPTGMDDYGWIAAAVGWSLWFLTLILLCVDKVMKLRPDEPKYLVA